MSVRGLILTGVVWVCVLVGCLFASGVAFAAAPEAPVTEAAGSVGANSAVLNGELNASALAKAGWYFAYNTGGGCLGDGATGREGEVEAGEKVSSTVSGLEPGTAYTFCLVAYNEAGEETDGSAETFTTSVSRPVVDSESALIVGSSTATVEAQVNPEKQQTTCLRFEYGETEAYGSSTPCTPSSLGEGFGDQRATANLTKLKLNTTYHFRVVVENGSSPAGGTYGPDQAFTTLPLFEDESFSNVGVHGATLSANLNVYGAPVAYYFEYGQTNSYGSSTSLANSGSAEGAMAASVALDDLTSGSEYNFRIVASVNGETVDGPDIVFMTLPASVEGLPDDRAYEMVTPIENENAEAYAPNSEELSEFGGGFPTKHLFAVEKEGESVEYLADPTHDGKAESSGGGLGSAYIARRLPGGGWAQVSIEPPGRHDEEYRGFSSNLSTGVITTQSENPKNAESQLPGIPAPPGYVVMYKHVFGEESYQPVFTETPPNRPAEFQSQDGVVHNPAFGSRVFMDNGNEGVYPLFAGASANFSQLLFMANDALIEGDGAIEIELDEDAKQEFVEEEKNDFTEGESLDYLYDSSDTGLSLVDVLPDGKVAPDSTFGGPPYTGARPGPYNEPDFSHAISDNGSRIFWSALEVVGHLQENEPSLSPKALYVRENTTQLQSPLNGQDECTVSTDACTVQVDRAVGGGGRFWTASSDGSRVFFTKGSLYEYDVNTGLTIDLTHGAEVQGVLGASESGDYVYYVDANDKLYVLHETDGEWEAPVFIAQLSPQDGTSVSPSSGIFTGEIGDWQPDMGQRTAQVTPNGQSIVFMSNQKLKVSGFPTGYENQGSDEVYVYSATTRNLSCASCDPSGRPGGWGFLQISWSDSSMLTWISEDGDEVFFDSPSSLVPQDTNGAEDVYEWEREGTGSCVQGSGLTGGCVYLLSGGTSNSQSSLIGASATGHDVFMVTRAQLVPEDENENQDVYDARVEGLKPVSPPACTGTGCQGVPGVPPTFATPSSVTYAGIGNFLTSTTSASTTKPKVKSLTRAQKLTAALKACRGGPRKGRPFCEAGARKRYGPVKKIKRVSKSMKGSR